MTFRIKRLALLIGLPMFLTSVAVTSITVFASSAQAQSADQSEKEVLYWYDPMYPQQRFDAPGPSPFMDMDLVPRYAEEGAGSASMLIDPSVTQNLGMRVTPVTREAISQTVDRKSVV